MIVREVLAKSVLNRSKIFDYCLNPYTGCQLNCRYCYARLFIRRYSGRSEPWGGFVDVKVNAPELIKKQAEKAKKGTVWVSSVCDPYQPLEEKYKLTRRSLEVLAKKGFPVNVQTKSILVLRDLDIFGLFKEIEVGVTIPTEDERISRLFEPNAATIRQRVDALGKIHGKGIPTFAFIGPLLPGAPENLVSLLEGKVDRVLIDRMNYINTMAGFYYRAGLADATTDDFFRRMKERYAAELEKRGMPYEILF